MANFQRVPFRIVVGGALSVNGQTVADLLQGSGLSFVSAPALLTIQAVIDPPPTAGDQVLLTLIRNTQNRKETPLQGSAIPVVRDGTVGAGPDGQEGVLLAPMRVAPGDSLTLQALATGTAADTISGRVIISLADVAGG